MLLDLLYIFELFRQAFFFVLVHTKVEFLRLHGDIKVNLKLSQVLVHQKIKLLVLIVVNLRQILFIELVYHDGISLSSLSLCEYLAAHWDDTLLHVGFGNYDI